MLVSPQRNDDLSCSNVSEMTRRSNGREPCSYPFHIFFWSEWSSAQVRETILQVLAEAPGSPRSQEDLPVEEYLGVGLDIIFTILHTI